MRIHRFKAVWGCFLRFPALLPSCALLGGLALTAFVQAENSPAGSFRLGWAQVDLTPGQPVLIGGHMQARISERVMDPITATVFAVESAREGEARSHAVIVSVDLVAISEAMFTQVREHIRRDLPQVDPQTIMLHATHSHSAPLVRTGDGQTPYYGIDLGVMSPSDYVAFASKRIAAAIMQAWHARAPGGIAFGMDYAVVGRNRLMSYADGRSQMYGRTDTPEFSHVEGYEDPSVNVLATYDAGGELTGLIVNLASPSQIERSRYELSADFWHDTREVLRARLGEKLPVLAQCSPAGDQNALAFVGKQPTEERMWRLAGRTQRQVIAVRIADAVGRVLPLIEQTIDWDPVVVHRMENLPLTRRQISEQDVEEAVAASEKQRIRYERLLAELEADPALRQKPRWYGPITQAYRQSLAGQAAQERFELQQTEPHQMVEVHALRLGEVAFATNPFELYLDYGMQIKGRSIAVQTFLVQLAGGGSYVPTERAIAGGAYGAIGTAIGPEGGKELVAWTVEAIRSLWRMSLAPAEWELAFRDDFDRDTLGDAWQVAQGSWAIEAGQLVTSPSSGAVLLTRASYPGLHRLVWNVEVDGEDLSDLSTLIHTGEAGPRSGYFLQFGGFGNTRNTLQRSGEIEKEDTRHRIVPGRRHTIVAELDGRHLRLTVDGQVVLEQSEDYPLLGSEHQRLGFYIWSGRVRIDSVRIYTAPARPLQGHAVGALQEKG